MPRAKIILSVFLMLLMTGSLSAWALEGLTVIPSEATRYAADSLGSGMESIRLAANGTMRCAGQPCPEENVCLGCGGRFHCVEKGTSCCFQTPCSPGNRCLGCGGQFHCVAKGSSCCGGRPCLPGNVCMGCGGQFHCVPKGSSCCFGKVCPPEASCTSGQCR